MKNVYLIRHGTPDFPEGKRMCLGTTDIPLSQAGFAEAAAMARKLPPVQAVFSSPLTRAVQTAEAIGLPITILPDLRELHTGVWDGLTFDQVRQQYPALYAARGKDQALPPPGAEDHERGLTRFKQALEAAAAQSPGDFAVVAHGGVIGHFLRELTGIYQKPTYAQIIPLRYQNGQFFLQEEI